jgi:hypothetical protein
MRNLEAGGIAECNLVHTPMEERLKFRQLPLACCGHVIMQSRVCSYDVRGDPTSLFGLAALGSEA